METEKNNQQLSKGSIIEGTVIGRDRSSLFVDLGIHGNGIIYGREFYEAKETIKSLAQGDKIYAKIVDLENEGFSSELLEVAEDLTDGLHALLEFAVHGAKSNLTCPPPSTKDRGGIPAGKRSG